MDNRNIVGFNLFYVNFLVLTDEDLRRKIEGVMFQNTLNMAIAALENLSQGEFTNASVNIFYEIV